MESTHSVFSFWRKEYFIFLIMNLANKAQLERFPLFHGTLSLLLLCANKSHCLVSLSGNWSLCLSVSILT
uniref:Uncharacterized protein n=2 Tax=Canis lupus familiaris TaxID=9615 RepID=A0A8C0N3W1_CANLF